MHGRLSPRYRSHETHQTAGIPQLPATNRGQNDHQDFLDVVFYCLRVDTSKKLRAGTIRDSGIKQSHRFLIPAPDFLDKFRPRHPVLSTAFKKN